MPRKSVLECEGADSANLFLAVVGYDQGIYPLPLPGLARVDTPKSIVRAWMEAQLPMKANIVSLLFIS